MNTNPTDGKMSLRDSAIIACLLSLAKIFTIFLPLWSWGIIKADTGTFILSLIQCFGAGFFTDFLLLSGLNAYVKNSKVKRKKET